MRYVLAVMSCLILIATVGCGGQHKAAEEAGFARSFAGDKRIMSTILKKFLADYLVRDLNITPRCYNGHAYLVGEYETEKQRERAVEIAKGIAGVTTLETYLLPKKKDDPCKPEDNLRITSEAKTIIAGDRKIWSKNLSIVTVQCNVVLMGFTGKQTDIQKVIEHAKSVEGVRNVKSYLKSLK
ncbi:MAG: BON domain-containing protein [Deltaproteobacteria bacterium]|nr:BON domain-containing protein [Deltaproteobacteria bacterium]